MFLYQQQNSDEIQHRDIPVQIVSKDIFDDHISNHVYMQDLGRTVYYYDGRDNLIARMDMLHDGYRYVIYPKRVTHISER